MRRLRPCLFLGAAVACSLAAPTLAEEPQREVRRIVYDYAVTSYCGTLTPQVEAGFKRELAEVTARDGLSAEEAKAARIRGWVDADEEWSNRGLGGFRAWCESEGIAAALHFQRIAAAAE
jgi:hypothetical protein